MITGILLAFFAGAFIALSMVTQRYALAYETYKVPMLCLSLPRPVVWFLGLIIYGIANGLYAVATATAPLSLVASLFTLLLVWNLVFAKLLLGEHLTPPKLAGNGLIILGALCAVLGQPGALGATTGLPANASTTSEDAAARIAASGAGQPPPIAFSVHDALALLLQPLGATYFALLLTGIVASTIGILIFERSYGLKEEEEEERKVRRASLAINIIFEGKQSVAFLETPARKRLRNAFTHAMVAQRISASSPSLLEQKSSSTVAADDEKPYDPPRRMTSDPPPATEPAATEPPPATEPPATEAPADPPPSPPEEPTSPPQPLFDPAKDTKKRKKAKKPKKPHKPLPPPGLNFAMSLVYPMSLGLLEGVSHLTMKAVITMFQNCFADGFPGYCARSGVLWLFAVLFVTVSLSTVMWLKIVFTRYETTTALPVEYGTVNACSVLSGLLFYNEFKFMRGWQLALSLIGLFGVLAGVAVSVRSRLGCGKSPQAKVTPE